MAKPKSQNTGSYMDELLPINSPGARPLDEQIPDGAIISVNRGELAPWPLNPRRRFDETELQDLGADLRAHGQERELVVRPLKGQSGFWEILGGERRWRAGAAEFGGEQQTDIPIYRARVRYPKNDAEALDIAWRDNAFSVPLTLIENSAYIETRIKMARESGEADSYRTIGVIVGLKKDRVKQIESLQNLPEWIRERFDELGLNEKHGRALLMLSQNDDDQRALFRQIERSANKDLMSGNAAVKKADAMRKAAEADAQAEAAPQQTELDLDDDTAPPDDAATAPASTRSLELNQAPAPAQTGNPDDADFTDDNWRSGVAAQYAGTGGVASTAPARSGSGFSTTPDAGATDERGPRKTSQPATQITPENIAAELEEIRRYYDAANFNDKVPAAFDAATSNAIDLIQNALSELKNARYRAVDTQRVNEPKQETK